MHFYAHTASQLLALIKKIEPAIKPVGSKLINIICALLAFTVLGTQSAHAQNIGSSKLPVYISSDRFDGTEEQGRWRGNVRIVQGEAILVADEVVGELDGDGRIAVITALDNVRYSDGKNAISGNKGIYQEKARTLTMTGNVIVTQGRNVFTAGSATYWIDTGKVIFTPIEGERVRGIFYTDDAPAIN